MNENNGDAKRHAEQLVVDLGKLVGIEGLALDADARCDLAFDDQPLSICYDPETGFILLEAAIMEIPSSPSNHFYSWVLEANMASFTAGHGCLALAPNRGSMMWLDRMPALSVDNSQFQVWLHRSIEKAEFWARQLPERANSADMVKPSETESWADNDVVFRA